MLRYKTTVIVALLFSLILNYSGSHSQDRPNILWLVTEDMSPYLSSYGNQLIKTPNLDKLAAGGIRYTKAFSNGTQCSPSRSTIILGRYAISMGTDYHRHPVNVADSLFFPIYLQKAGYYTVNNPKQDYNTANTPKDLWNAQGGKADYANRPDKSRPFYAQYNQGLTHMTRVAKDIDKRLPDAQREVKMREVTVPPYIPDLPEVRDDISWNMGAVTKMDEWVGEKIEELKKNGEYENTIIMFSSDHGGTVPRGKGYVYQTGTLIPLIIHFPEKWKHLAGTDLPSVSDRLVSFIDFAPTILSLAGQKIPPHMTGKPFLTEAGKKKENINQFVFTFRTNQSGSFGPSRAIHDGRYHLIWNFQSAYPNGTRQDYQWQMPAQQAWDKANMAGKLNGVQKAFWEPSPTFELYDVKADSLEVDDLAQDPKYSSVLKQLKAELEKQLYEAQDLGLVPPQYKFALQKNEDIVSIVKQRKIDINKVIQAAIVASYKDRKNLPALLSFLRDDNPMVQYWGASGICGLTRSGQLKEVPGEAKDLISKAGVIEEVSLMIAEAMVYTNEADRRMGLDHMFGFLAQGSQPAGAGMQNVGKLAAPIGNKVKDLLSEPKLKNKFYIRSTLINLGLIPYEDLYKMGAGESVPD